MRHTNVLLGGLALLAFSLSGGEPLTYIDNFESTASASSWKVTGPAGVPAGITLALTARERAQGTRSLRISLPEAAVSQVVLRKSVRMDLSGAVEVFAAVKSEEASARARLLVSTEWGGRERSFASRPAMLHRGWQEVRFRLDQPMFEEASMPGELQAVWNADSITSIGLGLSEFGREVFIDSFGSRREGRGTPVRPVVEGPAGKVISGEILEAAASDLSAFELYVEESSGGLMRRLPFAMEGKAVARFRLDEPGFYRWYAVSLGGPGRLSTQPKTIEVVAGKEPAVPFRVKRGVLKTDKCLAGIDIPWAEDYSIHLGALASGGGNLVRIWLRGGDSFPPWRRGRPDEDVFRRFDGIVSEANRLGIGVVLVLFSAEDLLSPHSPWRLENGGPCSGPLDLFALEDARRYFGRYVQYCVRRWSAYPNVLAMDVAGGYEGFPALSSRVVEEWFDGVRKIFRSASGDRPLMAVSVSVPPGRVGEMLSSHRDALRYPELVVASLQQGASLEDLWRLSEWENRLGTRLLAAGWRGGWHSADDTVDPQGVGYRSGLWAGTALWGWNAPLGWWWNSHLRSGNLYRTFSDIVLFASPVIEMKPAYRIRVQKEDGGILLGRMGTGGALVLVGSPGLMDSTDAAPPLGETSVILNGLVPGKYRTAVIDAVNGTPLGGGTVEVNGPIELPIEAATPAVVVRVVPEPGAGGPSARLK